MYCLSQFCCLCFCNNQKLTPLHQITCNNMTLLEVTKNVIPEIQLCEINHLLSACDNCVNLISEMHDFRKKCIHNNFLLVEYLERLSSFGGVIGNARIKLYEDFDDKKKLIKEVPKNFCGYSDFIVTKCDPRTLNCNETSVKNEFKVEVIYDFRVYKNKDELIINHGEVFEDPLLSTDNPGDKNSPTVSCEDNNKPNDSEIRENLNDHTINLGEKNLSENVTHTEKTPYRCETCGKCFNNDYFLKRHKFIHTENNPYKCEMCGKSFVRNYDLKRHRFFYCVNKPTDRKAFNRELKPGEESYKCGICGRAFLRENSLKMHEITHVPTHLCKSCGRLFHCDRQLRTHELIHVRINRNNVS